jgi:hypothetical protein
VSTLFGGENVNRDWLSGGRVRIGYWLDCDQTCGVEAGFFALGHASTGFNTASNGTPILARPFINTATNMPDAEIIAFPGIASGSITVRETTSLLGAGAWLRHNLCCGDCFRVDGLVGYRYLRLTGRLDIAESLTSTDAASTTVPQGTQARLCAGYQPGRPPGAVEQQRSFRPESRVRGAGGGCQAGLPGHAPDAGLCGL